MPQKHVTINVDQDWWDTLCAFAAERGVWPTHVLKLAADREMLEADFIPEPTPTVILASHDRHQ